jgi:hypothetical protein
MKRWGHIWRGCIALWMVSIFSLMPRIAEALEPGEVLIIANKKAEDGVELARYYAKKRDIPDANLLLLSLPVDETCSRDVYERQIESPVRAFLETIKPSWVSAVSC